MSTDVIGVALHKGAQVYAIIFTLPQRRQALAQCSDWARNRAIPEFGWPDALVMQKRIREQTKEQL